MKTIENPFILNGYVSNKYFCDREKETEQMTSLLRNGSNVVLTSPRRIGKSDLINHVFAQKEIKDKYITFYVDIYATQSLADLVDFLGKAIVNELKPKGRKMMENFISFLRSLHPQITFDAFGTPSWGIASSNLHIPETTLQEIFEYLASANKRCIVAIDEFQQITSYKDAWKVEALLRSHIQKCSNAQFIYSGSMRHLMAEIFNSPSRPFYGSVAFMSLPKIEKERYVAFCQGLFADYHKLIEPEAVAESYDKLDGVTAYVQRLLNMLFAMTNIGETCEADKIETAINNILDSNNDIYMSIYSLLTQRQREVLLAIAIEGEVKNIQGVDFIGKYQLGTASMVASGVRTLLSKDMITKDGDRYYVYDRYFHRWLVRTFWK